LNIETSQYNWFLILLFAVVALVLGSFGLFLASLRMYRTRKLSSFLFGALLMNLPIGVFYSWGVLYIIIDVILDLDSFETIGFDDKIILISFLFSIVITSSISLCVLVKKNIDGITIVNDLVKKCKEYPEDQSL
jgi:hypothetical protein